MTENLNQIREMMHQGKYEDALAQLGKETSSDHPEQLLMTGLCLMFTKQPQGAELVRQVMDITPANAGWQSDLALGCLLLGDVVRARQLLHDLIETDQADAVAYGRMGAVYLTRNELDKAADCYTEAVRREPGRAEWHNNLAGILVRQQKFEQALENYETALRLKPDLAQSRQSRERVLIALEQTEAVVAELEQELAKHPDDPMVKLRLARAYHLDNRPAEAIRVLRQELVPVDEIEKAGDNYQAQIDFRWLLADIFAGRSIHGRCLAVLEQLEKMAPKNPVPVICRQASALTELGKYDTALEKLDGLAAEYPDSNAIKTARANVLCESGDYTAAESILRDLLSVYPGDAGLLTQLGQTLLWVGGLDEAARCFEQAAEINPMALAQMVNARKIPDDPKALEKMRMVADNPLVPEAGRQAMSFALSTVYEKNKDVDIAFHYLSQANRLVDKGLNYQPAGFSRKIRAVAEIFTRDFFAALPPIRKSDRTPTFVVGMPRSGTTLTEQILSAHPKIFGAGELPLVPKLTGLLPRVLKINQPFPLCVPRMTPHMREEAARHYLFSLYEFDRDHSFVVDKMPHNFVNLGFIAMIFPAAKIIHVNRDPRDTAVSNYQQNFKMRHGGMGYAFDLEKIALQINDYHRLMTHWRAVLPISIFELSYEQMVEDMEGTAEKLLDFVGVGWHDDVARFYETKRAVRTASVSQVRQPIYKTSMKKWKRYAKHLGPLLEHLDPEVTRPYDAPDGENNPYESKIVCQSRRSGF